MNNTGKEDELTLQLLEAIERDRTVTQRNLASRLGVALGLTNSYLKRCARKGFIKVQRIPPNRYAYYLTPAGFSEKARLTLSYFQSSLELYRRAGRDYADIYERCLETGLRTILLAGLSDLTEIAVVRSLERDVRLVGIYDPADDRQRFLEFEVFSTMSDVSPAPDAVVVTGIEGVSRLRRDARAAVAADHLFVPGVLQPLLGREDDG